MAQLAILGHKTRGKEVIEILEMLGGKNIHNYNGTVNECYIIDNNKICTIYTSVAKINGFVIFTLEEFLEKFPYKVGDKVRTVYGKIGIINKPIWSNRDDCVRYELEADTDSFYFVNELQPYKEETNMKENTKLNLSAIDYNNGLVRYEIPEGYEFDTVIDNKVVIKKLKPKYPKTYEECCEVLSCKANNFFTNFSYNGCDVEISDYEDKIDDLLQNFRRLRYCRDAYWKIAGEQMGLGKPWEPDYRYRDEYYSIYYNGFSIIQCNSFEAHTFIFPTEEMRDAFYENFKKEIESVKELL